MNGRLRKGTTVTTSLSFCSAFRGEREQRFDKCAQLKELLRLNSILTKLRSCTIEKLPLPLISLLRSFGLSAGQVTRHLASHPPDVLEFCTSLWWLRFVCIDIRKSKLKRYFCTFHSSVFRVTARAFLSWAVVQSYIPIAA